MNDALWTPLVALALGTALAIPVFLIQGRRSARQGDPVRVAPKRRRSPAAAPETTLDPQARIAELEALLAAERARSRALAESRALLVELCDCYKRLIDRLSPGMLSGPEPVPVHRREEAA